MRYLRLGVLLLWAIGVATAAAAESAGSTRLIAIVDAGSSGSRLLLYQWVADREQPRVRLLMTNRDSPRPLSSFATPRGIPSEAGALGIEPMLHALTRYLAEQNHARAAVTVHVLGTAGMRRLYPAQAKEIYASVAQTVVAAGYQLGRVQTLSGEMEAVYSWVDVNYLHERLRRGQKTLGVVEIGGASAQVAFAVAGADSRNAKRYRVNGRDYQLFVASYLGLGQDEARRAMLNDPSSGGLQRNMCYPTQSSQQGPAAYDAAVDGLQLDARGSRYSARCAETYAQVITRLTTATTPVPPRAVSRLPGFRTMRFVGVSAVYFAFRDWGVADERRPGDVLRERILQTCSGDEAWLRVLQRYGDEPSVFAQNGCANATFINVFLYSKDALRLRPEQLVAQQSVDGQTLSWTRGAALMTISLH